VFVRNRLDSELMVDNNWIADVNDDDVVDSADLIYVRNRLE